MPSHTTYFTFCFTSSKCFCHLAVRKHWTKVLRFALTRAKWILCYDDFKDPHYLSFFLSLFRAAAWSVFCLSCCKCCFQCWIVVCKTLLMFQSISMCDQDFFLLDLHLKMILSRVCALLSKCEHLFWSQSLY